MFVGVQVNKGTSCGGGGVSLGFVAQEQSFRRPIQYTAFQFQLLSAHCSSATLCNCLHIVASGATATLRPLRHICAAHRTNTNSDSSFCGLRCSSNNVPLVQLDRADEGTRVEEFRPLVNPRTHKLAGRTALPCPQLKDSWRQFLTYCCRKPSLSCDDLLEVRTPPHLLLYFDLCCCALLVCEHHSIAGIHVNSLFCFQRTERRHQG